MTIDPRDPGAGRALRDLADQARRARAYRLAVAEEQAELDRQRAAIERERKERERSARIATYETKRGGPRQVISGPTRVTRSGRACMETKYSDGTTERRYLEDDALSRRDHTVLADGHERIERRNA